MFIGHNDLALKYWTAMNASEGRHSDSYKPESMSFKEKRYLSQVEGSTVEG